MSPTARPTTRSSHVAPLLLGLALATLLLGLIPLRSHAAPPEPGVAQDMPDTRPVTTTVSAPAKPLIFSDDFEAYGDASLWSDMHPFDVQSSLVTNGLWAARLTNDDRTRQPVYGQKTLAESYPRVFVRLRFQVIVIGDKPVSLFNIRPSSSASLVAVQIEPTGQISYVTGATGITATSTAVAKRGRWHDLQAMVDTTSTDRTLRIWLDDVELTEMRQDPWLGEGGLKVFQLGDNTTGRRSDITFDDVRIDDAYIPASRPADPITGTLTVRTIPPWKGISFQLDNGSTFVTDDKGVAKIKVDRWSTDLRRRITVKGASNEAGSEATFSQWREWISPHSTDVVATFGISDPITFSFVDANKKPVDNAMIDSVVLKSTTGDVKTLSGDELASPVLLTSTVTNTPTGLVNKPIKYVVDEVIIDGANVVYRDQQNKTFDNDRAWTIELLFYRVEFRASDAFFGTSLGKELVVEAADGTKRYLVLDDSGRAVIPRLPRGQYSVSVVGAGYSPPRPIMVSQNQEVDLEVISHLDIALVLSVGVLSVAGLLIIGRPFLLLTPLRAIRLAVTDPQRAWREMTS